MDGRNRSIFWGSLLIVLGVVWLLRSAEVIDPDVSLWPVLLIALGVWLLLDTLVSRGGMGRGFVWPLVLIAIGAVFLLRDLEVLDRDVSVWPFVLIAIGLGIVLSAVPTRRRGEVTTEHVALDGAASAKIDVGHGAGQLTVGPGLDPERLLSGSFAGGADLAVNRRGDHLDVRLRQRGRGAVDYAMPWNWSHGQTLDWRLELTRRVPLELAFKTGANRSTIDLRDLQVTELRVETGASQTDITLPVAGRVAATVKAGAAGVTITVPERTAARIVARTGLASLKVDQRRFPAHEGGYRSPDFETATDRVELTIEAGAAEVEVR